MTARLPSSFFLLTFTLLGATSPVGNAQIVPDTTLPVNSAVTQNGNSFVIQNGTTTGGNLFHSFSAFSVPTQQEAFFNNPLTINNIITRVTGGQISNIDGTIRANGTANLFLINPNGIVFGPNAKLSIGGSFIGSTANSIKFADGSEFSATNPQAPPLLTINVPLGLQFNGANQGAIRVEGTGNPGVFPTNNSGLAVAPGRTLALVGGDVTLTGGILTAESGRIEIGSVVQGEVSLTPISSGWRLGYEQVQAFKDIQLLAQSSLWNPNLISNSQGGIQVQAATVSLNQGSQIASLAQGSSPGGDITVTTSQLSIENGSHIQTLSFGTGAAGNVTVNAPIIQISGFAPLNPGSSLQENLNSRISSVNYGAGAGGNISVFTDKLTLLDGGQVSTFSGPLATGNGGNISVNASDSITGMRVNPTTPLHNSGIMASTFGAGNAGNVAVSTGTLTLTDGATIQSITQGTGKSGDISVNASESITLTGINPFEPILASGIIDLTLGPGNGGNINVSTERLTVTDGAKVYTATIIQFPLAPVSVPGAGKGNAGNVTVNANQSIDVIGTNPLAPDVPSAVVSTTSGSGNAGNVTVSTRRLTLRDGGSMASVVVSSASTLGQPLPGSGTGNGGNLTVNASELIEVIGSDPFISNPSVLNTSTLGSGNAGNAVINTQRLVVRDGGQVSSSTKSTGNSGDLIINATDSILVSGTDPKTGAPSEVSANALILPPAVRQAYFLPDFPTGNTGELTINTSHLIVTDGGRIAVQHDGNGNAGSLLLNADTAVLSRGGNITAATTSGQGGNVTLNVRDLLVGLNGGKITVAAGGAGDGGNLTINTDLLVLLQRSNITANAIQGKGGNIQINTQGFFISPDSKITASSQLGINGVVNINTPDTNPTSGLVELPTQVNDPSQQIVAGCPADRGNTFVVKGQGGLPPNPNQPLENQSAWQDWRFLAHQDSNSPPKMSGNPPAMPEVKRKHQAPIVEATGWTINQSGQVELVAQMPNSTSPGAWPRPAQCGS